MPTQKLVAVAMGGYSSEWQISLKSGEVVYKLLNRDLVIPHRIHILKEKWVHVSDDGMEHAINKEDFSVTLPSGKIFFDVVFIAIHGSPGENGYLQAYLELMNIPHTSCGMYQAALTFNKRDTLAILKPYGVACAKSISLDKGDPYNVKEIVAELGLPCFVKANRAGSSFGVSKVNKEEELVSAIENSFQEDSELIIESMLRGTEVSVGIIQYQGKKIALPPTEIVPQKDFFDYEAKYLGKSQEITPARITTEETEAVQKLALRVYDILKLRGLSRGDYILVNGEPHLLEINTIPGLTEQSILPKMASAAGIGLSELFTDMVLTAFGQT